MIDRNEYARWLNFAADFNERYHNHKETMAWVVIALYVPGIIYFGYSIHKALISEWVVIVVMVIAVCLVLLFAHMQFRNRWAAADTIHVLLRCWADLNCSGKLPEADEWRIDEEYKKHWPLFVQGKVDKLMEKRKFWKHCRKFVADDRGRTEVISYVAIILATVVAMFLAFS